jgi:biopolymer transport protein ExbD
MPPSPFDIRSSFRLRASSFPLAAVAFACALAGCEDGGAKGKPAPTPTAVMPASAARPDSEAPSPTATPKPTSMPSLNVDSDGPFLNGTRINLAEPTGPEKLTKVVKDLPILGKPVTLFVEKKAKTSHVAAVVAALGDAGAPMVTIKTDGRGDLPKEIAVTPDGKGTAPPGCAVVTMVLKELSTAIWAVKGGIGKKQGKGLAGPDLSRAGDQLTKDIAACDAHVAYFSGDDAVPWELVFSLAGTALKADEKKKLDALVLLRETPVAGHPVTIGKH